MKRHPMKALAAALVLSLLWTVPAMAWSAADPATGVSPAQQACIVGWHFEKQGSYFQAYEHYQEAAELLKSEPANPLVKTTGDRMYQLALIMASYPLNEEQARTLVARAFPEHEKWEIDQWFEYRISDWIDIDGERYYTDSVTENLKYRDMELMHAEPDSAAKWQALWDLFAVFFPGAEPDAGDSPNINPRNYKMVQTINVPRSDLPARGLLKIWLPYPIETDCQTGVELIGISPAEYAAGQPDPGADLGQVYFEIPLDKLKEDLSIAVECDFTHYQQQFVIDPARVEAYDKNSELYRQYTRSQGNTVFNESIRQTALRVTGGESNPCLAAQKIYNYVVKDIAYSFMPHVALPVLGWPESVFVHENGYGDCGSQSMYFSALCRSIGIPARTTGGYQMFSSTAGTHFWAEFYLPGYGWVPVDTSVAQLAGYSPDLSPEEIAEFEAYFFANQDPYRMVIQKDVDLPLIPEPDSPVLIETVLQIPNINVESGDPDLSVTNAVITGYKMDVQALE